jgi:hypothetical protein
VRKAAFVSKYSCSVRPLQEKCLGGDAGYYCGRSRRTALLEARPAKHGAALCGLKRNSGFGSALRTNRPGFCAHAVARSSHALDLALFASLWIVLELLVVKEQLLSRGKDKIITAVQTFQYLVDEIHYASPQTMPWNFQYSVDESLN